MSGICKNIYLLIELKYAKYTTSIWLSWEIIFWTQYGDTDINFHHRWSLSSFRVHWAVCKRKLFRSAVNNNGVNFDGNHSQFFSPTLCYDIPKVSVPKSFSNFRAVKQRFSLMVGRNEVRFQPCSIGIEAFLRLLNLCITHTVISEGLSVKGL